MHFFFPIYIVYMEGRKVCCASHKGVLKIKMNIFIGVD